MNQAEKPDLTARMEQLVRSGRVRAPKTDEPLDVARLLQGAPIDPEGLSLKAILRIRREGR